MQSNMENRQHDYIIRNKRYNENERLALQPYHSE